MKLKLAKETVRQIKVSSGLQTGKGFQDTKIDSYLQCEYGGGNHYGSGAGICQPVHFDRGCDPAVLGGIGAVADGVAAGGTP